MLQIVNKKKFSLFLLLAISFLGLFSWGVFWFLNRPQTLTLKNLETAQKEELKNSVTEKNLSVFQFTDAKSEEKKKGEIKLTATENNEHGSKESNFLFPENYQDGYKFIQNKTEIQILPKLNNSKEKDFQRKIVSRTNLGNEIQTNTGQLAVYEGKNEKHLFSFTDETNTLKNWSYYEKPQDQIEETWEFKGAILKKNEDNSIAVYRLPVKQDSQTTAQNLEPDMAQRIANTLKEELGDDYYFQKQNYLFSLPAPFYLTQTGERKTPQIEIENQNHLKIKFETQKEEFPILLDPTITLSSKMDYIQINGDGVSDGLGASVSDAGDVNGDGLGDIIVGADGDDDGGSSSGSAFIFYGGAKTTGSATSRADVKITGDSASDYFGRSVSGAGDVNGDGKDDVIVGATGDDDGGGDSGSAFIFYGGVTSGGATAKANVKITGDSAGDEFGRSVSGAGDVNGDGKDDVIVGAYGDDDGGSNSGSAFIFYGGVSSGSATGKADVKITGDSADDNFGFSVSGAGDVNGDGKDDIIVGAYHDDDGGGDSGSAFIFYGGVSSGTATAQANVKITGDSEYDYFGFSVSGAGDVNGDGKDDVIVGAYGDDDGGSSSGSAFIFYGGVTSGGATAKADVKITGAVTMSYFGYSVSGAGDINGDGKDDVIVGAYYSSNGSAYIFYGGVTSGSAVSNYNMRWVGDSVFDDFGRSVSGAGDVNGDGKDDVIVGARGDDDGGDASGSVKIYTFNDFQNSAKIVGDGAGDRFGYSVSGAGDVNGDGKDDVIVGAYHDDDGGDDSGSAFIFYGRVGNGTASGKADVKLTGDSVGDSFGSSVSGVGDVNGDGKDDVIVGAEGDDDDGLSSGSVFIFYGGAMSGVASAVADVKIIGDSALDQFGYSVSGAGDVNGDGKDDVIVGVRGYSSLTGAACIFYGGVTSGTASEKASIVITGDNTDDRFGSSVSGTGDMNADGKDDVIVGAPYDDDGGSGSGSVFIFYGGVSSGGATAKANVKLTGEATNNYFGSSVSGAGDVNGDGKDDVAVGANGYSSYAGAAYIFYGGVTNGTAVSRYNVRLTGDTASDYFGTSVSGAGDVNGDGKDDVIVGSSDDDDGGTDSGSAFIFYGGVTSGTATTRANTKLVGDNAWGNFGYSVSGVGDVNGDGKDDVIVGAPYDDSGSAFIFTLGPSGEMEKISGDSAGDYFGYSVSGAGDMNGDGKDDVIVGASSDDDGGSNSGSAFIFYGGVSSGSATAQANVKITGDSEYDNFGDSVSGAGDVNGDGKDDVIVGAYGDDDGGYNSGSTFIFYGGVTSGGATAKADVKITGDGADDSFGEYISDAGDMNGDGKGDVIVSAYADDDGGEDSGSVFIFYGGITSGTASGKANVKLTGESEWGYMGSVSGAGDVNGDGKDDVIVGSDGYSTSAGAAYIVYGGTTSGPIATQANVKITGDNTGDIFGASVSGAGDINGDGKDDVIVGASGDDDGGSSSGSAFIFYGGVTSGAATTQANVKLTGDSAVDYFGASVSGAGDINGDGKADVIVGAPYDDDDGNDSGSVFIFYGGVSSGSATEKADVKLLGEAANDNFGSSVSGAGDVNGDGKADVLVGATGDDDSGDNSGSVKIITDLATKDNPDSPNFQIDGDSGLDNFGVSVSGAGDVNGDGKDDVIVGAPYDDDNGLAESGSAFIFYGGVVGGAATRMADVKLTGEAANNFFGSSVSGAGDVNGDGKDDVIVGAYGYSSYAGVAYIFYGGVTSGTVATRYNVRLTGDSVSDYFGFSVSGASDMNGDGKDDVIVGAYGDDDGGSNSGSVFIFYGGVASGAATIRANVKLIGGGSVADEFGEDVSGAGDMNGDGKNDVIVGGYYDGGDVPGEIFIFYGGVTSGSAETKANVRISGDGAYDYFGSSVSGAGDINGDGKDDVIIGASWVDEVFIFYGGVTSGVASAVANVKITGDSEGDYFGSSVSGAGDINGDGKADVIVGAPYDDDSASDTGSTFIFYGGVTSGTATAKANVKISGETELGDFGGSVSGVGDVNGDGKDDVIVGAGGYASGTGAAHIYYGHRLTPDTPTTLTPTSGTYTFSQNVNINCSGGTYNTTQNKYGQTIVWDIDAFYAGAWHELASDDADGQYAWNITGIVPEPDNVQLRCRNDISGTSGGFSPWFLTKNIGLDIVQGGEEVRGRVQTKGRVEMR